MSASAKDLVIQSIQVSQSRYDHRERPEAPAPSLKSKLDLHGLRVPVWHSARLLVNARDVPGSRS